MDPNECLKNLLECARYVIADDSDGQPLDASQLAESAKELADHVLALHEWMRKGGAAPQAWSNDPNPDRELEECPTRCCYGHGHEGACCPGWIHGCGCESHGNMVAHATLDLARSSAADPHQWCDDCARKGHAMKMHDLIFEYLENIANVMVDKDRGDQSIEDYIDDPTDFPDVDDAPEANYALGWLQGAADALDMTIKEWLGSEHVRYDLLSCPSKKALRRLEATTSKHDSVRGVRT